MFEFARGVQKLICQKFYNYIFSQSRRLGAPCNLIFKLISCFFHRKCVFIWFLFSRYRVQFFQKIDFFLVSAYVIIFWPPFFQFIELKSKGGAVVTPPPSGVELWRFPLICSFLFLFFRNLKKVQKKIIQKMMTKIYWIYLAVRNQRRQSHLYLPNPPPNQWKISWAYLELPQQITNLHPHLQTVHICFLFFLSNVNVGIHWERKSPVKVFQ